MSRPAKPLDSFFWDKVKLAEPDQCWIWTGSKATSGKGHYGQSWNGERKEMAHRVAYKLTIGPIPDGMEVCHTCDNSMCVNPQHLWLGTHRENMMDKTRKGRGNAPRGERAAHSKLTASDVETIREMYRVGCGTQREIAKLYGISAPNVSYIVNGRNWAHITSGGRI